MNNFLKFSNSYGHLIISVVAIAAGVILCLAGPDGTVKGTGVFLVTTATGYWFVSSAATHNQPPPGTP